MANIVSHTEKKIELMPSKIYLPGPDIIFCTLHFYFVHIKLVLVILFLSLKSLQANNVFAYLELFNSLTK